MSNSIAKYLKKVYVPVLNDNIKRRRMIIQAVLAVMNHPRIKSVYMRLRNDAAWFDMALAS